MDQMLLAIQKLLAGEKNQITIRHLFYRLASELQIIPKTETAYKSLCQHLSKWRRSGEIAWAAFADNTRWHIARRTFDGIQEALRNTAETYRRNLWSTQAVYVEVWVEKDSIASIVAGVANSFGVPVFVCRGFASLSSLYDSAETFRRAALRGKRVIVCHLGDYDPSGLTAGKSIISAFRDDFKVQVEFCRLAITQEQIQQFNLPTRPTKQSSHSKGWAGGDSVELDAMRPAQMRNMVENFITGHIDNRQWQILKQTEAGEREQLQRIWKTAA